MIFHAIKFSCSSPSSLEMPSPFQIFPSQDALIWGTWKLLTEAQRPSFWQGPSFPNRSSTASESTWAACAEGCLFELEQDPTEQRNLYRETWGDRRRKTWLTRPGKHTKNDGKIHHAFN